MLERLKARWLAFKFATATIPKYDDAERLRWFKVMVIAAVCVPLGAYLFNDWGAAVPFWIGVYAFWRWRKAIRKNPRPRRVG